MEKKLPLSFILSFCREVAQGHGEDSFCYSFCGSAGILGAFDGCGGAGARKHRAYSGHTEAFMASRLCAGAFYDAFREVFPCDMPAQQLAEQVFAPRALERLTQAQPPKDGSVRITGSMIRTLPTTAAAALLREGENGQTQVSALWAGDSRVYLLDSSGLAQLTVDDTSVTDPMENTYEDGVLRNVFCTDRKVTLHCNSVTVSGPFVVFAATDGCFGYLSTPMEFEGMVLGTLLAASCAAQWEQALAQAVSSVAGDDHTLCLAAVGYDSFGQLQDSLRPRYDFLQKHYLSYLAALPLEDRQTRFAMWDTYRDHYSRYLKGYGGA